MTICNSQASGGGQLTSTLLCVMITTEAFTNPYHSLPWTLTLPNIPSSGAILIQSAITNPYQKLPNLTVASPLGHIVPALRRSLAWSTVKTVRGSIR